MKCLKIDPNELILALISNLDLVGGAWYLDRETGAVLLDNPDSSDDLPEGWEEDPRYLYIRAVDSHTSYEIMQDFVDRLPEGQAASALQRALDGRKPFRHFKDAIYDYPELPDEWFKFEHAAHLKLARQWCEAHDIRMV